MAISSCMDPLIPITDEKNCSRYWFFVRLLNFKVLDSVIGMTFCMSIGAVVTHKRKCIYKCIKAVSVTKRRAAGFFIQKVFFFHAPVAFLFES